MFKIVLSPGQEDVTIEIVATEDKASSANVKLPDKYWDVFNKISTVSPEEVPDKTVKPLESDTTPVAASKEMRDVINLYAARKREPEQPIASFKENSIIEVDKYPGIVWKLMEGKWYETVGNKVGDIIKFAPGVMGRLSHKEIKRA